MPLHRNILYCIAYVVGLCVCMYCVCACVHMHIALQVHVCFVLYSMFIYVSIVLYVLYTLDVWHVRIYLCVTHLYLHLNHKYSFTIMTQ